MPTVDSLTALLAAPPRVPADPDLFSSNVLFGEPGISPQGTPMTPAEGPATSESVAAAALTAIGVDDAAARLAEPALRERARDAGPRAGLLALSLTVAAPLLRAVTRAEPPAPLRYDDALGEWWSARGVRGALSLDEQWRAAHALGLVDHAGAES